jgi:uncharacterized protein involved in exopolysaccharide biosynthesis
MDDELDIGEYIYIVKRNWLWAVIGFILVLGAIVAYTYTTEPIYEATSLVVLTSQDQANFLLGSSAPKTTDLETQKVIIQSPSVMYQIYTKYGEDTFELTVNIIKNSNILEIVVTTNNPENAASLANNIAESYINYTTEARKQDAENNIAFIADKIETYDKELNILDLDSAYYKANEKNLSRQEKLEYQTLQREMTAKTKIYDYLLNKKEEAALTANLNSANLKIIQYAELPEMPIKPNKQLNLALGFILALGAGFGLALLINGMRPEKKVKHKF